MNESFLYFGYGCALSQTLVEFRVNTSVEIIATGELKHYALKFNRKNPDGTARGNLCPVNNDYTLGVVYKIDKNKFEQLAQTEPKYALTQFDILTDGGVICAYAFICQHCEVGIIPDTKYVNSIAEYARTLQFPETYIEKILMALPKG